MGKNNDASAANVLDLTFIKQVGKIDLTPEKLKFFVDNLLPAYRKQVERSMILAMLSPDPPTSQQDESEKLNPIRN